MEVKHTLSGIGTVIGDQAEISIASILFGNVGYSVEEACYFFGIGMGHEICEGTVCTARDHQNMGRGAWSNIIYGDSEVVLIDRLAWDLAAQDFSENVVWIVTLYTTLQASSKFRRGRRGCSLLASP